MVRSRRRQRRQHQTKKKKKITLHALSPHYAHSNVCRHSRESSSTNRFSGSLKRHGPASSAAAAGSRHISPNDDSAVAAAAGADRWKDSVRVIEEGLLDEEGQRRGIPWRCYVLGFVRCPAWHRTPLLRALSLSLSPSSFPLPPSSSPNPPSPIGSFSLSRALAHASGMPRRRPGNGAASGSDRGGGERRGKERERRRLGCGLRAVRTWQERVSERATGAPGPAPGVRCPHAPLFSLSLGARSGGSGAHAGARAEVQAWRGGAGGGYGRGIDASARGSEPARGSSIFPLFFSPSLCSLQSPNFFLFLSI